MPSRKQKETASGLCDHRAAILFCALLCCPSFSRPAELLYIPLDPALKELATRIRDRVQISADERNWLVAKPRIHVRVGDYPPFHFVADGVPQGLGIDYMSAICMAYSLDCDYVPGLNSTQSMHTMTESDGISVQSGWRRNAEREQVAIFTQPYVSSPFVIFQRKGSEPVLGLEDLAGRRVVVEKGYAIHRLLESRFPALRLIEVDFSTTALKRLASGQADAYVSGLMTGHLLSQKLGLSNIVVSAPTPFEPNRLWIAVRKDWPLLASLIDKAQTAITDDEHLSLRNRWLNIRIMGLISKERLLSYGAVVAVLVVLLLLIGALLVIRRMSREIRARRIAERQHQVSESRLREAMEGTDTGLWEWNPQNGEVYLDPVWFRMLGHDPDTMPHTFETFDALLHPDDRQNTSELIAAIVDGRKEQFEAEFRMRCDKGGYRWIQSKGKLLEVDAVGRACRFIGIHTDISDRKQAEQAMLADQRRLKTLAAELTRTEERERRKIAADLHDRVGQSLAIMRIQLATARRQNTDNKLDAMLGEVSDALRGSIQDTRNIISDLSPPILKELGLSAAIEDWLTQQIEIRYGLETRFSDDDGPKPLNEGAKAILYRSVRELLMNVVKHAGAHRVDVDLGREGANVRIVVQDDGIGLNEDDLSGTKLAERGFGLFSIKERMNDIGGAMTLESVPGQGVRATLISPLDIE
jgi:PAS domain S-box-containing protein